jgi:hypothetical protein
MKASCNSKECLVILYDSVSDQVSSVILFKKCRLL